MENASVIDKKKEQSEYPQKEDIVVLGDVLRDTRNSAVLFGTDEDHARVDPD
jgi:hypothetical protein